MSMIGITTITIETGIATTGAIMMTGGTIELINYVCECETHGRCRGFSRAMASAEGHWVRPFAP
jgi:hypothetical protein